MIHKEPIKKYPGYLGYAPFRNPKVEIFLSLAAAGDMSDPQGDNRRNFFKNLEVSPSAVFTLTQTHSKQIYTPSSGEGPQLFYFREGDGLVSSNLNQILGVTVADCVPIFLYCQEKGVFAALHSGWKGTGIVIRALEQMEQLYGCHREEVEAFFGPSIRSCCYTVDPVRGEQFLNDFGADAVVAHKNVVYLDLPRANELLLQQHGVHWINDSGRCTCCDSRFGSYRREGAQQFSRMLALISIIQ